MDSRGSGRYVVDGVRRLGGRFLFGYFVVVIVVVLVR